MNKLHSADDCFTIDGRRGAFVNIVEFIDLAMSNSH